MNTKSPMKLIQANPKSTTNVVTTLLDTDSSHLRIQIVSGCVPCAKLQQGKERRLSLKRFRKGKRSLREERGQKSHI